MTAKKDSPAKRGRKPAPPEQRTEPFSIRLTAKQRFGVELLSRAQRGKSLSQVVEWALQRGLNSIHVGNEGSLLGDLVDQAWELPTQWARVSLFYHSAPELLDFSERAVCEAVFTSVEYKRLAAQVHEKIQQVHEDADGEVYLDDPPLAAALNEQTKVYKYFDLLVEKFWDHLVERVSELDRLGKDVRGKKLVSMLPMGRVELDSLKALESLLIASGIEPWQPPVN